MSLEEDLDLGGIDVEKADKGNNVDPGWYAALVHDIHDDPKGPGTLVFVFQVRGGAFDGAFIHERLWNPANRDNPVKLRERRATFAKRLGLIDAGASGTSAKFDWHDALGAEVALRMVRDKRPGHEHQASLEWAGLYSLSDPRVPASVRGGPATANGQSPPTTTAPARKPAKAQPDYGSLPADDYPL